MAPPSPTPTYIYKILPPYSPPPSPLPEVLPLSALDARDQFLHFSTSQQILGSLSRFFASDPHVFILRIPYSKVEQWIKWENGQRQEKEGTWDFRESLAYFPHVYGNGKDGGLQLGKEEVESVGKWEKGSQGWSGEGWPWGEDVPV